MSACSLFHHLSSPLLRLNLLNLPACLSSSIFSRSSFPSPLQCPISTCFVFRHLFSYLSQYIQFHSVNLSLVVSCLITIYSRSTCHICLLFFNVPYRSVHLSSITCCLISSNTLFVIVSVYLHFSLVIVSVIPVCSLS